MQVAIILPPRATLGQRLVREYFQPDRCDAWQRRSGCDGISVAFRPWSARKQRAVRLTRERGAADRHERLRLDDLPLRFSLRKGAFPFGHFALRAGSQQQLAVTARSEERRVGKECRSQWQRTD